jgi:alpha-N-arabinofuranosidase
LRASITVDPQRVIGHIDPNIYGQFLCRRRGVADGGLFAPEHPDADDAGLRKTVVDAIAATGTPIVRWPGGCTGTSYDWKEGIGPREQRERTIDVHFGYDVSNGFGTAEFVEFCRRIGAEPHFNLSTGLGTLRDALEWLEYTNFTTPSRWANLRRAHGYEEPFDVRYWQIGNENYGPWEIGHQTPYEYGIMAREWAKTFKKMDRDLKMIAVGGSDHNPDWDVTVLDQALPHIDYLTAHRYWNFDGTKPDDQYDMIAGIGYIEEQLTRTVAEQIEHVARDKKTLHRPKIAFTEWNVRNLQQREMTSTWVPDTTQYRLTDALAVAGFLNMMQRQSAVVTLASFAQSINVVGMLMVTDDHVIRETIYWPLLMQRHLSGNQAVDTWVECDGYTAEHKGRTIQGIPYLDVSSTVSDDGRKLYVSVVNRHRHEEMTTVIRVRDASLPSRASLHQLFHEIPDARNSIDQPDAVKPVTSTFELKPGTIELSFPPHSYSIVELDLGQA